MDLLIPQRRQEEDVLPLRGAKRRGNSQGSGARRDSCRCDHSGGRGEPRHVRITPFEARRAVGATRHCRSSGERGANFEEAVSSVRSLGHHAASMGSRRRPAFCVPKRRSHCRQDQGLQEAPTTCSRIRSIFRISASDQRFVNSVTQPDGITCFPAQSIARSNKARSHPALTIEIKPDSPNPLRLERALCTRCVQRFTGRSANAGCIPSVPSSYSYR